MGRAERDGSLLVVGASGHARVVADIARLTGERVAAFAESAPVRDEFLDRPLVALEDALASPPARRAVVAIGNPTARRDLSGRLVEAGFELVALVHPRAVLAADVEPGPGTVIAAGAVVNPGATLDRGVIVNTGGIVDHDCRLADWVHVCPGTTLAGGVTVGEGAWLGVGSCISDHLAIGPWSFLGAGSVVVEDVPAEVIAFGNPARVRERRRYFVASPA